MLTRDQRYAMCVRKQVQAIYDENASGEKEKIRRRYGVMSHKLPVLIRSAGLVQALAFVESRAAKDQIYGRLLDDLAQAVQQGTREALLERSRTAELMEYILLTQQVLDALLWYKRFAQSILNVDASDRSDDEEDRTQDTEEEGETNHA